jgi:integrase
MSTRITPWSKNGKSGWEVDFRVTWADGSRFRARKKSPFSAHDTTRRWAVAHEAEIFRRGKDGMRRDVEPAPSNEKTSPTSSKKRKGVPTLSEFSPRFLNEYARAEAHHEAGVDGKESILRLHLLPYLGKKRLDEITTLDTQRLKTLYREGIKGSNGKWTARPTTKTKTINNRLTVLNKLLKVACEWGVIASMPATIRLLKISEDEAAFYEPETLEQLYEAAVKVSPEAFVMVLLGGDAGLRRGEIIGLNQTDLDLKRRLLHVRRHVYRNKDGPPKNGKPREVPLTDRLYKALSAHRHLRGERVLYFCEQRTGKQRQTTPKVLSMWMQAVERRAMMPSTGRLHVLRHTFCSRLAMANAPVKAIQELAGHASLKTTLRYMHLAIGAKHEAISLLDRPTTPLWGHPGSSRGLHPGRDPTESLSGTEGPGVFTGWPT